MSELAPISRELLAFQATTLKLKIDLKETSKPFSDRCQMVACNDIEAILEWLDEYKHKKNTYAAYKREALRFLLWCMYERGKNLSSLKKEDMQDYFKFLQAPPKNWCEAGKNDIKTKTWKPFKGPLSPSALFTAIRILKSLFSYLIQAEYLRVDPIKLIKQYKKLSIKSEGRKHEIRKRILGLDEFQAIQDVIFAMPEATSFDRDNKNRTQFLFSLLYFLALRIHEVANHTWGDFYEENGKWWFLAKGKGDGVGHVPVNHQLLEHIKAYRQYLGKTPLPEGDETEALLISQKTQRPLKVTQLYSLVKSFGQVAAERFPEGSKQYKKLKAASPHWIRHLSASHQSAAGMPLTMIKDNLRHGSIHTTQIYVHTEDEERFLQMQKLQLNMQPCQSQMAKKIVGIEYHLTLKKGPINKAIGLNRLLAAIEQLFKGMDWKILGEPKAGISGIDVQLAFKVISKEVVEAAQIFADTIKRQCEIWLFDCELQAIELRSP